MYDNIQYSILLFWVLDIYYSSIYEKGNLKNNVQLWVSHL